MSENASSDSTIPEAVRLAELEGEIARLKDTVLRSQADQQNQQRRHVREREELRKYANAGLLEELLPAIDSLNLGLESANSQSDGRAVAEGFRMAIGQLISILATQGLVPIQTDGQIFDPARHEAVGSEPSDSVPEGMVLRNARTGWLLRDRVLRPAAVFVSSGPAK